MVHNDLINIINETPRTVPVFKIIKLPKWLVEFNRDLKDNFTAGMLVYWDEKCDTFKAVGRMNGRDHSSVDLAASNIEFVGYRTI
jgi:hypothetical protein